MPLVATKQDILKTLMQGSKLDPVGGRKFLGLVVISLGLFSLIWTGSADKIQASTLTTLLSTLESVWWAFVGGSAAEHGAKAWKFSAMSKADGVDLEDEPGPKNKKPTTTTTTTSSIHEDEEPDSQETVPDDF